MHKHALIRLATRGGAIGQLPPPSRNFHKPMYLLGAATSYIILPPPKISVGCDPDSHHVSIKKKPDIQNVTFLKF